MVPSREAGRDRRRDRKDYYQEGPSDGIFSDRETEHLLSNLPTPTEMQIFIPAVYEDGHALGASTIAGHNIRLYYQIHLLCHVLHGIVC